MFESAPDADGGGPAAGGGHCAGAGDHRHFCWNGNVTKKRENTIFCPKVMRWWWTGSTWGRWRRFLQLCHLIWSHRDFAVVSVSMPPLSTCIVHDDGGPAAGGHGCAVTCNICLPKGCRTRKCYAFPCYSRGCRNKKVLCLPMFVCSSLEQILTVVDQQQVEAVAPPLEILSCFCEIRGRDVAAGYDCRS